MALAGVARPDLVRAQLDAAGMPIANWRSFPDHHRYSEGEINWIARQAREGPIVTTLKDAVKLAPALPPECEIWVPLQQVVWEAGQQEIESLIGDLLAASTAGGRQT